MIILLEFYYFTVTMYNLELTAGNQKITSSVLVGTSVTKRSPHNLLCEDIVHERKRGPLIFHFCSVLFRSYSDFNRRYVAGSLAHAGNQDNTLNLKAVKVYKNFKEDRVNILKDGKDRSGVNNPMYGKAKSEETLAKLKKKWFGFMMWKKTINY